MKRTKNPKPKTQLESGAPTRVIFMGTPDFAVPTLEALVNLSLIRAERRIVPERSLRLRRTRRRRGRATYEIIAAVTQPNRPVGRKQMRTPPPLKLTAQKLGLPVLQPEKLSDPQTIEQIRTLSPDLIVVVAYGKIIPETIIDIPKYGAVNVHASLLPKYRGASPIEAAIAAGENETGVTIMQIDEQLDHGPILAQARVPIAPNETGGSLSKKLARVGAELLVATLPEWIAGRIKPHEQDHSRGTMTKLLTRDDGKINWSESTEVIERKIRAYHPWPGTWTTRIRKGKPLRLNILKAIVPERSPDYVGTESKGHLGLKPGTIFKTKINFAVQCNPGALEILTLQPEGKRSMSAVEFLRGHPDIIGAVLS